MTCWGDERRVYQLHGMPERLEAPRPFVGSATCFHANQTWRPLFSFQVCRPRYRDERLTLPQEKPLSYNTASTGELSINWSCTRRLMHTAIQFRLMTFQSPSP